MENRNWQRNSICPRDDLFQFPFSNWSGRRGSNPRPTAWKAVTLPLSYSRPLFGKLENGNSKLAPGHPVQSFQFQFSNFQPSTGGQGRIRTSVDRKGRQVYSLLLLTAQPPVRPGTAKAKMRDVCSLQFPKLFPTVDTGTFKLAVGQRDTSLPAHCAE